MAKKSTGRRVRLAKGRIGDKVFYISRYGHQARARSEERKKPVSKKVLKHREEFVEATSSGKTLRLAFKSLLTQVKDTGAPNMPIRLMSKLFDVIQSDTTKGKRTIMGGDLELLKGFDFNAEAQLRHVLRAHYVPTIDRATGVCKIEVASFTPQYQLSIPTGATHFQIVSAGAAVDFVAGTDMSPVATSTMISVNQPTVAAMVLQSQLPANSKKVLFLALGVLFFQGIEVGAQETVQGGTTNALCLVLVNKITS